MFLLAGETMFNKLFDIFAFFGRLWGGGVWGGWLWWLCGRVVGSGAAGLAFLGLSKGCLVVFSPFRAVGATRLLRLILQISFSGSSLVVSILDIVYAV